MNKVDLKKQAIRTLFILFLLLTLFSTSYSVGFHYADEIFEGNFTSDYNFTGSISLFTQNAGLGIGTDNPQSDITIFDEGESGITFINSHSGTQGGDGAFIGLGTTDPILRINQQENADIRFLNNGERTFTITGSGNVGIGNGQPSSRLHVFGTTLTSDLIVSNQLSCGYLYTDASGNVLCYDKTPDTSERIWNESNGNVYLYNTTSNVGIGTTSPSTPLTVAGGPIRTEVSGSGNHLVLARTDGSPSTFTISNEGATLTQEYSGSMMNFVLNGDERARFEGDYFGIGTTSPTSPLDVVGNANISGTLYADDIVQRYDSLDKSLSLGILIERVAMTSTTVQYATVENDTKIFRNGLVEVEASNPEVGTFSVNQGDIIVSNKPTALLGANDEPLPPLSYAGTKHTFISTRNAPHTMYIYAPYGPATVEYNLDSSPDGSPDAITTVETGGFSTLSAASEGTHRLNSSSPVIILKEGTGGDNVLLPPVSKETLHSIGSSYEFITSDSVSCASGVYCTSEFGHVSQNIGDGSGGDSDMGIPRKAMGDTYIIPHNIADYALVAIEPTMVNIYEYNSGDWQLYDSHDMTDASSSNPREIEVGTQDGAGVEIMTSAPIMFVGTAPFYLRTNEPGSNDEYSVLGYRSSIRPYVNIGSNDFVDQSLFLRLTGGTMSGSINMGNNPINNIDWANSDDGPGSGLDADTVDGLTSNTFVRRDGVNSGYTDIRTDDTDFIVRDSTDPMTNFIWRDHSENALYLGTSNAVATLRSSLDMNNNGITNINWGASDDGAGSGLDADTVDGMTSTDLVAVAGDTMTGNLDLNDNRLLYANAWQVYSNTNSFTVTQSGTSGAEFEIVGDGSNFANADLEVAGNLVWTEGNDGPSSGLNADLLDGQSGAYYLDNTDYCSGGTCPGDLTLTGGNRRITSNGGWAMFRSTNSHVYIDSAAGSDIRLRTNGNTERMRITSNGNVGIGTNSPNTPLTVAGGPIRTEVSGPGNHLVLARTDGSASTFTISNGGNILTQEYSATEMAFVLNGAERARLSGNSLGIGTNNPEERLHINNGNLLFSNSNGVYGETTDGSNARLFHIGSDDNLYVNANSDVGDVRIQGGGTNRVAITSAGNVGIGTMSPSHDLDISGDLRFTGTLQGGTVPWARLSGYPSVNAGTGLTGGGSLSATRTINLDTGYTDGRYVRETGDTMTGNLNMNGNQISNLNMLTFDGGDSMVTTHDGYGNFNILSGIDNSNTITSTSGGTRLELNEAGYLDVEIYSGSVGQQGSEVMSFAVTSSGVDINGNTVWHAGNDGPGSGLNADLLDGQSGAYYLDNTDYCSGGTCGSLSLSGNLDMNNNGITNINWGASDDGSGSGLDADLLDGQNSNSFLAVAGDTMTGGLTFNLGSAPQTFINFRTGSEDYIFLRQTGNSPSHKFDFVPNEGGVNEWGKSFGYDFGQNRWEVATSLFVDGGVVWHTANDGSGSGLDADLWDGNQFSSYLNQGVRTSDSPTFNRVITDEITDSSGAQLVLNAGESSGQATGQTGELVYINAENGLQVTSSPDNWASGWAGRDETTITGTAITVDGNTVWHQGNDGSGSGLDSDRLDGQQGSYYLDNTDYCSGGTCGSLTVSGTLTATSTGAHVFGSGDNAITLDPAGPGAMLHVGTANGGHDGILLDMDDDQGSNNFYALNIRLSDTPQGHTDNTHTKFLVNAEGNLLINRGTTLDTGYWLDVNGNSRFGNVDITGTLDMNNNGITNINWGASDDGSGSGLDADLLDGQSGAYYLDNTDYCSGGTCGSLSLSGNLNMNNNGITNINWGASNDGPGSGLDADRLDGINSVSFLRSDVDDIKTSGTYIEYRSDDNSHRMRVWMNTDDRFIMAPYDDGAYQWGREFGYNDNTNRWYVDSALDISGNTAWHAGNDGPGSGLNADLLDGQSGAYYLDNTDYCSGGTCGSLSLSGNLNMNGNRITDIQDIVFQNQEQSSAQGGRVYFDENYYQDYSMTGNGGGLAVYTQDGWGAIIATNNMQWVDADFNSLTVSGNTVWHEGNDGPSSNLNADLLDGQGGPYYLDNTDYCSGGTCSGSLDVGNSVYRINDANNAEHRFEQASDGTSGVVLRTTSNQNEIFQVRSSGQAVRFAVHHGASPLVGTSSSWTINGNAIWHQGNDGPSSGLDADRLDGQHASAFLTSETGDISSVTAGTGLTGGGNSGAVTLNLNTGYTDGRYVRGDGNNNGGVNINVVDSDFVVRDSSDSPTNYIWRDHSASVLYLGSSSAVATLRSTLNLNNEAITNINWGASDDGSGSGLDADTVDGINSAGFIRSNANDNVAGHTEWQDNYQIRLGNGADFRMWHTGSDTRFRSYNHGQELRIQGENSGGTTRNLIRADPDNWVRLFYSGNLRLETTSSGVESNAFFYSSDERLKTNFTEYDQGLSEVLELEPQYYYWKDDIDKTKQIGLTAQEVQKIIPELVREDEEGYLSIDYGSLTPLLINAVKDQQELIEEQEREIKENKQELEELEEKVTNLENDFKEMKEALIELRSSTND